MAYIVKYARHHESMEETFGTREEAMAFARITDEYEQGFVKEIVDTNGAVFMDGDALSDFYVEFDEYFERHAESTEQTIQKYLETHLGKKGGSE